LGAKLPKNTQRLQETYIGSHSKQISTTTKNKRWMIYIIKRKKFNNIRASNRQPTDLTKETQHPTTNLASTEHVKRKRTARKTPRRKTPGHPKTAVSVVVESGRVACSHHAPRKIPSACIPHANV
jgi:DNA-directed RNA polymerase specialized sigma24 family protein